MERRDTIEIAQAEVREPGDQREGHGGEIRNSPKAGGASGRARGESTLAEGGSGPRGGPAAVLRAWSGSVDRTFDRVRDEPTPAEGVPARAAAQLQFCALGVNRPRTIGHLAGRPRRVKCAGAGFRGISGQGEGR